MRDMEMGFGLRQLGEKEKQRNMRATEKDRRKTEKGGTLKCFGPLCANHLGIFGSCSALDHCDHSISVSAQGLTSMCLCMKNSLGGMLSFACFF